MNHCCCCCCFCSCCSCFSCSGRRARGAERAAAGALRRGGPRRGRRRPVDLLGERLIHFAAQHAYFRRDCRTLLFGRWLRCDVIAPRSTGSAARLGKIRAPSISLGVLLLAQRISVWPLCGHDVRLWTRPLDAHDPLGTDRCDSTAGRRRRCRCRGRRTPTTAVHADSLGSFLPPTLLSFFFFFYVYFEVLLLFCSLPRPRRVLTSQQCTKLTTPVYFPVLPSRLRLIFSHLSSARRFATPPPLPRAPSKDRSPRRRATGFGARTRWW